MGDKMRMKIAFCIPEIIIGGVECVFIEILDGTIKKLDTDVVVVTQKKIQDKYFQEWFRAHPNIKLYTMYPAAHIFDAAKKYMHVFPLKNIRKIIYSLYKKYKNHRAMRRGIFSDCDLVIDYKNASFAKILRKFPNKKITWIHGSIDFFTSNKMDKYLALYDKVVCLTHSFESDFKLKYPKYANKIVQIYNPINTNRVRQMAKDGETFNGKYFCAVSRLDADKDIKTIIDAFGIFWDKAKQPDVNLVLVGDGSQATALRKYAENKSCGENIIFVGATHNPFGYMRGAIAHILSSYNEGMGMVLVESAACGTINIASNCKNGPAEILMNGDAGLLFTPGDANELAKLMQQVWHNEIDVQKIVKNATDGLDRFSTDKIATQISELFKSVMGNAGVL